MNLFKQCTYFLAGLALLEMTFSTAIAKADDRNITPEEMEKIVQTLKSIDCTTYGEAEYETTKNQFEIDNVVCNGGQTYEIYLDQNYRVIKKELDN